MEANAFTEPGLVAILGGCLLAVGVFGLLRARDERTPARVTAFLAMCAALYAAFDFAETATRTESADLQIVTTGSADAPWLAARAGPRPNGGTIRRFAALDGQLGEAGLAAALASAAREEVVLVWDGPVRPDARWPLRAFAASYTTRAPGVFEPGDLVVRIGGGARAGRPLLLEFDLDPAARERLPEGAQLEFGLRGPDGTPGPSDRIEGSALRRGAVSWEWPVAEAGSWNLSIELSASGQRLVAEGALAIGPPAAPVVVLGPEARAFAAALAAQAVPAEVHATLPAVLDGVDVVVATGALSDVDAARLLEHVDRGGGLVTSGGPSGGALPLPGDPLAAIVPLLRQPVPDPSGAGDGGGSAAESEAGSVRDGPAPASPDVAAQPEPVRDRPTTAPPSDEPQGTVAAAGQPVQNVEVERRQVALVLVIDRSSSMGTSVRGIATRMDFAKRAAFETALRLEPGDELGVLAFGVRAYEVLPLGRVPDEADVQRELEALRAIDGQTILGGAVGRAGRWLMDSKAAVRHAVILTDGDRLDAGDLTLAQSAARRMGEAGITVSVIQIADTAVGLVRDLNEIARQGRGVFLRETDGSAIPRLVFAEVRRMFGAAGRVLEGEGATSAAGTGAGAPEQDEGQPAQPEPKEPVEPASEPSDPKPDEPAPEEPDPAAPQPARPEPIPVVVLEEGPLLGRVPEQGLPDLLGVSPVAATERARVLVATVDGTPLLATAHAGLGRVVAWAADVAGPWTAAWREDPLFPARLAGFVSAVRPADTSGGSAEVATRTAAFEPATPRRATWRQLELIQGGPEPQDAGALRPGPDRRVSFSRRRGLDLALGAVLGSLALALVERFRRGAGR